MEKQKYAVYAITGGKLPYFRIYADYDKGLAQVAFLLAAGVEEAGITGDQAEISSLGRRKFRGR